MFPSPNQQRRPGSVSTKPFPSLIPLTLSPSLDNSGSNPMNFKLSPHHFFSTIYCFTYISIFLLIKGCSLYQDIPVVQQADPVQTTISESTLTSLATVEPPKLSTLQLHQAKQAVVEIYDSQGKSLGSGVIIDKIDPKAYILTVAHLVENNSKLVVNLFQQGDQPVSLVYADVKLDLALLEISLEHLNLPANLGAQLTLALPKKDPKLPVFSVGFPAQAPAWTPVFLEYQKVASHLFFSNPVDPGYTGAPVFQDNQMIGIVAGHSQGTFAIPSRNILTFLQIHPIGKLILKHHPGLIPLPTPPKPSKTPTLIVEKSNSPNGTPTEKIPVETQKIPAESQRSDKTISPKVEVPTVTSKTAAKPVETATQNTPVTTAIAKEQVPVSTDIQSKSLQEEKGSQTGSTQKTEIISKSQENGSVKTAVGNEKVSASVDASLQSNKSNQLDSQKVVGVKAVAVDKVSATIEVGKKGESKLASVNPTTSEMTASEKLLALAQGIEVPATAIVKGETELSKKVPEMGLVQPSSLYEATLKSLEVDPLKSLQSNPLPSLEAPKPITQDAVPNVEDVPNSELISAKSIPLQTNDGQADSVLKSGDNLQKSNDQAKIDDQAQVDEATLNELCGAIAINDMSSFRQKARSLGKGHTLVHLAEGIELALTTQDQKTILETTLRFLFEAFVMSKNSQNSRCTPALLQKKSKELESLRK